MAGMLMDIAQWIRDRPISDDPSFISPNGHSFASNDNEVCRETFNGIEALYLGVLSTRDGVSAEFSSFHVDILEAKGDVKLVDNEEFIGWAATYTVYPPEDSEGDTASEGADEDSTQDIPTLPALVAFSFLSEAGARPITNEAELATAMTAMYYGRAELGLESPSDGLRPDFDNDALRANCSNVTLQVAYNMEDEISVAAFAASDLENQREFLKDVALWLTDN